MSMSVVVVLLSILHTCLSDIDCDDKLQCYNQTIVATDEDVNCNGYVSCFLSNLTLVDDGNLTASALGVNMKCDGLRSCQNTLLSIKNDPENVTSSTEATASISGYLGLSFVDQIYINKDNEPVLECLGEASCYGIKSIASSYQIECNGARSCNDIDSAYITNLYGYGMFSLMGSNFYSYTIDSSDTVSIKLYGYYSGFNSSFWCLEGYSCEVDCGDNGCENFNYYCDDNAVSCEVTCGNEVSCPNGWSSNGVYNGNFDNSQHYGDYNFSYTNDLITELLNKVYSQDIDYELMNECPNNDDVGCDLDGDYSCGLGLTSNVESINNSVCINGYRTFATNEISIYGENSKLYCNGKGSCDNADIYVNGNNVYCRGAESCDDFSDARDVISTGDRGLSFGEVVSADEIGCFGYESCYASDFSDTNNIYLTGYRAGRSLDIFSNGSDINIYLLGYQSGYFTEIECSGTDTCTIYGINSEYGDLGQSRVGCDSNNNCTIEWIVINQYIQEESEEEEPQPQTTDGDSYTSVTINTPEYGYQDTCPEGVLGCSEYNGCAECMNELCVYCQNIGGSTCGTNDCMTCINGYDLIQVYNDGTGYCEQTISNSISTTEMSFIYQDTNVGDSYDGGIDDDDSSNVRKHKYLWTISVLLPFLMF